MIQRRLSLFFSAEAGVTRSKLSAKVVLTIKPCCCPGVLSKYYATLDVQVEDNVFGTLTGLLVTFTLGWYPLFADGD